MHNVPPWLDVATGFGVHVIAPDTMTFDGEEVTFTALIRDCDSGEGVVVDPDWNNLERHTGAIRSAGFGYSCVELTGIDRDGMAEILADWFGAAR